MKVNVIYDMHALYSHMCGDYKMWGDYKLWKTFCQDPDLL
mgnify:CR=1 FL=1